MQPRKSCCIKKLFVALGKQDYCHTAKTVQDNNELEWGDNANSFLNMPQINKSHQSHYQNNKRLELSGVFTIQLPPAFS